MDLLEIKKQHVSAYHWPSSGLILNNASDRPKHVVS